MLNRMQRKKYNRIIVTNLDTSFCRIFFFYRPRGLIDTSLNLTADDGFHNPRNELVSAEEYIVLSNLTTATSSPTIEVHNNFT